MNLRIVGVFAVLANATSNVLGASVCIGPEADGGNSQLVKGHEGGGNLPFTRAVLCSYGMLRKKDEGRIEVKDSAHTLLEQICTKPIPITPENLGDEIDPRTTDQVDIFRSLSETNDAVTSLLAGGKVKVGELGDSVANALVDGPRYFSSHGVRQRYVHVGLRLVWWPWSRIGPPR